MHYSGPLCNTSAYRSMLQTRLCCSNSDTPIRQTKNPHPPNEERAKIATLSYYSSPAMRPVTSPMSLWLSSQRQWKVPSLSTRSYVCAPKKSR